MYFRATGGAGGAGATLTVTYSEDFYGLTITATNGTRTLTKVATSSGSVVFRLPADGTWTVSATVEGQIYSKSVLVDTAYSTELSTLPAGSTATPVNVIQTWLKCAQIKDKNYTTLSQVLNDMATFEALVSDSNACDYMARSTDWASDICADAEAMHLIGKYDYCANALLGNSTWATAIGNSTYFESVLTTKVPIMTSNTAPSGVASASTSETNYDPWKAFAGDSINNGWTASSLRNNWIQYKFTLPVVVQRMYYKFNDKDTVTQSNIINLTGSNDGINWTDVKTNISVPHNNTAVYINIENTTAYLYYRITYTTDVLTGSNRGVKIQFYGRAESTMIPLVPKMTSNTTPSGEVVADSYYSNSYYPYYAFDNNSSTTTVSQASKAIDTYYLGYKFPQSTVSNCIKISAHSSGNANQYYYDIAVYGSNDLSTFQKISDNIRIESGPQFNTVSIPYDNSTAYLYNVIKIVDSNCQYSHSAGSYALEVSELQFYYIPDSSTEVLFRSAAEDDLYYMDNGSPVIIAHTDDYGYAVVDRELLPEGVNLTVYSTVAKDPSNLGNAYTKTVHFSKYLTEVRVMPLKEIYWYGYGDVPSIADSNLVISSTYGWTKINGITKNTNNVTIVKPTTTKQYCATRSTNLYNFSGKTVHTIINSSHLTDNTGGDNQYVLAYGEYGGGADIAGIGYIDSSLPHLENVGVAMGVNVNAVVYAIWLE